MTPADAPDPGVRRLPRVEVDPDVRRARTLPSWAYRDPAAYARLLERAFAPSWQPLEPEVAELPAGRCAPFALLPGSLEEPLVGVRDAALLERGAGAGLDRVEREDEEVVEAVQRGLRSRLYSRGRFSPSCEQGVHAFHRLVAHALGE